MRGLLGLGVVCVLLGLAGICYAIALAMKLTGTEVWP